MKMTFSVILLVFILLLASQVAFAQSNNVTDMAIDVESSAVNVIDDEINNNFQLDDALKVTNEINDIQISNANSSKNNEKVSSSENITILIVSDNPGTNILDSSCRELFEEYDLSNVNLVVRSGIQVKEMDESEFTDLLANCDGFIGEWVSTDVDAVLTSVLNKNPSLSDKKLFLILEAPVGNLNSGSSSIGLVRHSTLNYNKIFDSCPNERLISIQCLIRWLSIRTFMIRKI